MPIKRIEEYTSKPDLLNVAFMASNTMTTDRGLEPQVTPTNGFRTFITLNMAGLGESLI